MLAGMRTSTSLGIGLGWVLAIHVSWAKTTQPGADSKPASTNVPGQQYPQVDSERHATFRVVAPGAQSVRVNLGGGTFLTKDENGVWTGTTRPLDPGFYGSSASTRTRWSG
jgi:hypothetical protein